MQMDIWYDTILLEMSQEQHRFELISRLEADESSIEESSVEDTRTVGEPRR